MALLGPPRLTVRILVTGGFGFIGGRLARHFVQAGHEVVLGSRRKMPAPVWLPQVEVTQMKWDECDALESSCNGADVVIHAAGMNAKDCAADPEAAYKANGRSTERLVNAAARAGVKQFIYFSTAHVYASPLAGIITEETLPCNPHPYATSHLAGETAVAQAHERGVIQGTVIRLSNAYGAPTHKDANCWMLLVNDLCRQAVQTGKLVLQSNGLQQRDFICMSEVSRVVGLLLIGKAAAAEFLVFNVGVGQSQSVLEMALLVQQRCVSVLGFHAPLEYQRGAAGNPEAELSYQSNHLIALGVHISQNKVGEIDKLLKFCQTNFLKTK